MAQLIRFRMKRRPPPKAVDDTTHIAGLRAVAVLEGLKGTIVLLVEIGFLSLLHKNTGEIAERLVRHFHMNPEHHFSHVIIDAATKLNDGRLWALAAGAAAYSTVRFVEAYGLWHARVWAEWFALLSGALYLPWELYEIAEKQTLVRWAILGSNLVIMSYMLYIRIEACRPGHDCEGP